MKKIYTSNFEKKAQSEEYKVNKDDGFYETIRETFDGDKEVAKEIIDEFKTEEVENEILQGIQEEPEEYQPVGYDGFSNLNDVQRETMYALQDSEQLTIVYVTQNGHKINRTIQPLEAYMAKNGNRILLTWCLDWNDYRAFIIDNIITIVENDILV